MTAASPRPGPAPIDPRIRARRVAVVRAEGRRRLRVLLAFVAAASFAGLVWLAVTSPLLDVDHLTVTGTRRVLPADVLAASGVHRGDAILFVDTGAVRARVEALPWVESAVVNISISGDVELVVTEREPAAWAQVPPAAGAVAAVAAKPIALIDGRGRVVMRTPAVPPGLPELRGLRRVPPIGRLIRPARAARLVNDLPATLRPRVTTVALGGADATLLLASQADGRPTAREVRLGPLQDLRAKGIAALAVLEALGKSVDYVDVRVPAAPATGGG